MNESLYTEYLIPDIKGRTGRIVNREQSSIPYVAPFLVFVGVMAVGQTLHMPPQIAYPLRVLLAALVLLLVSRPVLTLKPAKPLASVALGLVVFAAWVTPDMLFGYRHHWLFTNSLMPAAAPLPAELRHSFAFLAVRAGGSALLVPVVEELFWRAWLMRWLIHPKFEAVPLGSYVASAFWITAVLFALEHNQYWEVGLVAGIAYNWWMVRTKSLADCILAHGVTNAALAAYVIAEGAWQYW